MSQVKFLLNLRASFRKFRRELRYVFNFSFKYNHEINDLTRKTSGFYALIKFCIKLCSYFLVEQIFLLNKVIKIVNTTNFYVNQSNQYGMFHF